MIGIDGEFDRNPSRGLCPSYGLVVEAWAAYVHAGLSVGPLPYPGGYLDQPCWLMAAFAHLSTIDASYPKQE